MKRVQLLSLVLALILGLGLASVATTPVHAEEPYPAPAPSETPVPEPEPEPDPEPVPGPPGGFFGILPDPKQWAADVFNQVLVDLLRGLSDALRAAVAGVLGSSLNFITRTPPAGSYASPTVQTLWGIVRTIANVSLALAALWGGINLILREHIGSPYHEAMQLFPRLALGALLANTSLSWAQLAIDVNNALCLAIGPAALPAWDRANGAGQLLVDVIATLIYLVTSLLLLLQMLMRLALIDVLLVVAPLGLVCWVLPQTQGWARLWSSTFFGTVFTQFVQVVALKLGASLLTELNQAAVDAGVLAIFLGVAVLALTLRIPSLMRGQLGDGLGFVRYFTYRQGARSLEGRGGGA